MYIIHFHIRFSSGEGSPVQKIQAVRNMSGERKLLILQLPTVTPSSARMWLSI